MAQMHGPWRSAGPAEQQGRKCKAEALGRVASQTSVLEPCVSGSTDCSEGEYNSPVHSALSSPVAEPLLDAVMVTICAAARFGNALPLHTCQLLQQLFPSAHAISATVPSADGLGMAVVTLMHPPAQRQAPHAVGGLPLLHRGAARQVMHPLPAGGVLCFGLGVHPPVAEQQLMAAFAAELSSRLDGGSSKAGAQPLLPGAAAPGAPMPHDCFWMSF